MAVSTIQRGKECRREHAYSLLRQHFTDFYGGMSAVEVDRLIASERRVASDVARRCYMRGLLAQWGRDSAAEELQRVSSLS